MSVINALFQKQVAYELAELRNEKQDILDTRKLHVKILAFLSDLGKVAEESGCLGFWSAEYVDKKAVLESYVDTLQILLSIGFQLRIEELKSYSEIYENNEIIEQFLKVYQATLTLQKSYHFHDYQHLIDDYFALGFALGFDMEEIVEAYKHNL